MKAKIKRIKDWKRENVLLSLAISVILTGTFVYHFIEGWNYLDSLYFTVITLTTVGYGDLSPQTPAGKIFTMFFIFTGLGIILSFIEKIANHRVEKIKTKRGKN